MFRILNKRTSANSSIFPTQKICFSGTKVFCSELIETVHKYCSAYEANTLSKRYVHIEHDKRTCSYPYFRFE